MFQLSTWIYNIFIIYALYALLAPVGTKALRPGSFYSHGRSKHAALSDGRVMLDTQRGQEPPTEQWKDGFELGPSMV